MPERPLIKPLSPRAPRPDVSYPIRAALLPATDFRRDLVATPTRVRRTNDASHDSDRHSTLARPIRKIPYLDRTVPDPEPRVSRTPQAGNVRTKKPPRAEETTGRAVNDEDSPGEIDFADLLGREGANEPTRGTNQRREEEEADQIRETEKRLVSLRDLLTGNDSRTSRAERQWKPPSTLKPVNRKQLVAPDLETAHGDILVTSGDHTFPTFSLATVDDDETRLSSAYARNVPDHQLLFLLAPSSYHAQRRFSYQTRWENLNTRVNSVQSDTLRAYERLVTRGLELCEEEEIPPKDRFPASPRDVNHWVGSMGRTYSAVYLRSRYTVITDEEDDEYAENEDDYDDENETGTGDDCRQGRAT